MRFPVRLNDVGVYAFGWNFMPYRSWLSLTRISWSYRVVKRFKCGWLIVKAGCDR